MPYQTKSQRALERLLEASGVEYRVTSSWRDPIGGTGSYHNIGWALDFAGRVPSSMSVELERIYRVFAPYAGVLLELMYAGGAFWKRGMVFQPSGRLLEAHRNHIHVAVHPDAVKHLEPKEVVRWPNSTTLLSLPYGDSYRHQPVRATGS